jgi:carboxylesterase
MLALHSRAQTLATQRMLGRGEREFFAPGRGPCIIAFHGFTGTMSDVRPLLEPLAAEGHAIDGALLPGHGTGAHELQDRTFDEWVEAARARLRAAIATHGSAVALGFSLGSLVAMQLASERTSGLRALIVAANALRLSAPAALSLGLVRLLGLRLPDQYLVKPRSGELVDPAAMDDIVCYDRNPLRAALQVYLGGCRTRAVVGAIACPTLIVHGRRDGVCPSTNARWLARRIGAQDVTLRIFERSAHVLGCDGERAAVSQEIVRFLRRVAPPIGSGGGDAAAPNV